VWIRGNIEIEIKIVCKNVDWIQLAQDRGQWWALVNTVIWLHNIRGIS
jgi:hypothetical protein